MVAKRKIHASPVPKKSSMPRTKIRSLRNPSGMKLFTQRRRISAVR